MFKTLKKLLVATSMLGMFLAPVLAVGSAAAQVGAPVGGGGTPTAAAPAASDPKTQVCEGVGLTGGGAGCNNPANGPSVESTVKTVVNLLSLFVGIAAVIMVIVGGLKYIISSGDSNNINSAKNTILYAIIGLVIVALAQVLVRFVLNKTA